MTCERVGSEGCACLGLSPVKFALSYTRRLRHALLRVSPPTRPPLKRFWLFPAFVRHFLACFSCVRVAMQRVINMELSLKGSGIVYEPGDVIGLRCPNPADDTAYVLQRLQVSQSRHAGSR